MMTGKRLSPHSKPNMRYLPDNEMVGISALLMGSKERKSSIIPWKCVSGK